MPIKKYSLYLIQLQNVAASDLIFYEYAANKTTEKSYNPNLQQTLAKNLFIYETMVTLQGHNH